MPDAGVEPKGRLSQRYFSPSLPLPRINSSRSMALAAGKVEDIEEAEAALLAAHGRKHGGEATSSAASDSSTSLILLAASGIGLEELILAWQQRWMKTSL